MAGFVAGSAMGLLVNGLFSVSVVQHPGLLSNFRERFPEGTALPLLTAAMAMALQAAWGGLGLGVGGVYWGIQSNAQNGLGSPAWGFTLFFVVAALLVLTTAVMIQPSWWRKGLLFSASFAATFGWLLPNLAEA